METYNFQSDSKWIGRRLSLDSELVAGAIRDLVELGFIEKSSQIFLICFALPKNTLAQFNVYGQESHGGDLIASEFIIIAQKIQSMIDKTPELFLPRSRFSLQYSDYLSRVKILVLDKMKIINGLRSQQTS